ncbi:hypothetical protein COBT_002264 [Conglomerata obtusa]
MDAFTDKNFNKKEYIQTNYRFASHNDLDDRLLSLNKSIRSHQTEAKNLVSNHFDKFIECRTVMDSIKKHMDANRQLREITLHGLDEFNKLDLIEYDLIKKKGEIKKEFAALFMLRDKLESCDSYEEFVDFNRKAYGDLMRMRNSKYLKILWSECDDLRRDFLDKMCGEIASKDQCIDDVIHFFKLYFQIEDIVNDENNSRENNSSENNGRENDGRENFDFGIDNNNDPYSESDDTKLIKHNKNEIQLNQNKPKNNLKQETMNFNNIAFANNKILKIENTFLLNTKLQMKEIFRKNNILSSVEEIKPSIVKIVEYKFSNIIKEEILKSFNVYLYNKLEEIQYDEYLMRLIVKEIDSIVKILSKHVTASMKYKFIDDTNKIRNKIIEITLYKMIQDETEIKKWCSTLEKKIMYCQHIKKSKNDIFTREKIKNVIWERLERNYNLEELMYVKNKFIKTIKNLLKEEISQMHDFYDLIKKYENQELQKIVDVVKKEIEILINKNYKNKSKTEIIDLQVPIVLMHIIKLIKDYPNSYAEIIEGVFHSLENNVCKYFLKDICRQKIELTDDEKMHYYKYKNTFDFLIKDDELKDDSDKRQKQFRKLKTLSSYDKEGRIRMDTKTLKEDTN